MTRCVVHGKPVRDGYLCAACVAEIERCLAEIPALDAELTLTLARQGVVGVRYGSRSAEQALPYRLDASTVLAAVRVWLVGWVRVLHGDDDGHAGPVCYRCDHGSCGALRREQWPVDTVTAMSRWLLSRLPVIRQHPAAVDFHGELIANATSPAWRRETVGWWRPVDRDPDRWYAGPCLAPLPAAGACPADLYAEPDAGHVVCVACRTRHDVAERRAWLLAEAEDRLATATELARAVASLGGVDVTPTRVWQWKARGRLLQRGVTVEGWPLFRVGDALDLLAERPREVAAKEAG